MIIALLYSSLALPTVAISVYIHVSVVLSSAFILMQHVILVDWGYTLSSAWGRRERWWLVALLLISLVLVLGSIAWRCLGPSPFSLFCVRSHVFSIVSIYDIVVYSSCRLVSTVLLVVTVITTVASVVVRHGSILTAGIVALYAAQLIWSALHESDCSTAGAADTSTVSFHQDSVSATVASLLVRSKHRLPSPSFVTPCAQVMMSLVYSSMDASTHQSTFSFDSTENDHAVGVFSYPLFHAVFCLGSMYMGMALTGWSSELDEDSGLKNRFIVKITSAFVLHAVYLWTLVAPSLLSNRRFDYDDL
jgi:hypothetical protein